jgi:uncharacterized protein (TIGR02246 family)
MPDDDLIDTPDDDHSADEIAIRALIDRQIDSWNAADPGAYARAYTVDGDCVSFLGTHYRGREAIAASYEVPRATSVFRKLLRGTRLRFQITQLRFLTPDVAIVHATGGVARGSRANRRNLRTNTSIAVRTDEGWRIAASQNTTRRPVMEMLASKLIT